MTARSSGMAVFCRSTRNNNKSKSSTQVKQQLIRSDRDWGQLEKGGLLVQLVEFSGSQGHVHCQSAAVQEEQSLVVSLIC